MVVVVGSVVVAGAAVVVVGAVVVGAVVAGAAVVVGSKVDEGAAVVVDVAVSELPPHPKTTNRNVNATRHFLMDAVCHAVREGGRVDTASPRRRHARLAPPPSTSRPESLLRID